MRCGVVRDDGDGNGNGNGNDGVRDVMPYHVTDIS